MSGRHRWATLGAALIVFWLAALPCPCAHAQWLETGPFTATNTYSSAPGILNSSTGAVGMSAQGNPVYGATNAILQSPLDPNTYWAATVGGGIWKTTNGGVTWTPTTDHQASLAIGAITLDTSDPSGKTLYAGTGDYSAGGYPFNVPPTLLKSTDGGNSWTALSSTGIQNLYLSGGQQVDTSPASIKYIVAMGNTILVAAGGGQGLGNGFNTGGLYRSTNGGATFSLVSGFDTEVSSLFTTQIGNQTVLLAARNGYADHNASAVLYSIDSGVTWTTLLGPNTPVRSTNSPNPDGVVFNGALHDQNIKVAVGPGGSLFVAVVKQNNSNPQNIFQPIGLFYAPQFSPGSGTPPTWYSLGEPQMVSAAGDCTAGCTLEGNPQGALHFALVADPKQAGVAYIAGSGLFNLTLPGLAPLNEVATIVRVNYDATAKLATYTPIAFPGGSSSPHADTRALVFDANGNLLAADDGGVYTLTNPATSGTWTAFGGVAAGGSPLRAIETYATAMDPKTGRLAYASQDNGAGFSAPATLSQIAPGAPWQTVLSGDGFSVAVNSKTSGPSIFYATADDPRLARSFANENLSSTSPPNLLTINVAGTNGQGYRDYQADASVGIVMALNAVDPSKILFRSSRLYTWADPGTTLNGSINIADISSTALFSANNWTEKIAYGTRGAPDAILAGGLDPSGNNYIVYLRTQEQFDAGQRTVRLSNQLASFPLVNNGRPSDPVNVMFDPATEKKFFIADSIHVYETSDTGQTLTTLSLQSNFQNPTGLTYIADANGYAINGVRRLVVGGNCSVANCQGKIIATADPFAANVQWTNLGQGLPNATVDDLKYYPDTDTMVAATYGRGVHILYDVTSHFPEAIALWFGKANNDSAPDPALLTGSRPLEKFGIGTLTLSGPATYTGGTFILGGTVAVGADNALGDPSGQIGIDAATLRATASFATARTVTFGVDGGTVDVGANKLTASGLWAAQGPVNKIGSGVLALQGLNWLQNVMVSAGTLELDGSMAGMSLQVAQGAALTGNGLIAAPTTISGTLAPGAGGPGVLAFTSPVTMTPSSTLRVAVDGPATSGGPGSYSQVIVNGASLTLRGTLSPYFRGIGGGATNTFTPALGQYFTIATATGGVSGQFAGIDLSSSGLPSYLRMDALYGVNAVGLVTTPSSYASAPVGSIWSANQQNVGAALDALRPAAGTTSPNAALQNAYNALYGLSAPQIGPTLTGLSAEAEARGVANALDSIDALHNALQDHLTGSPIGAGFNNLSLNFDGGGRNFYSSYNRVLSGNAAPPAAATDQAAPPPVEPNHWWSSVFYQASMRDSSAGIAGGSANISGIVAGIEGETRPGRLIGGAFSTVHTEAGGLASGSGDNFAFVAYGRQTTGPLQAAAYAGFARGSFDLHHDFGTPGGSVANQPSGASSLLAGGSIAYTVNFRGFQIAPTLTASFTHLLFDGVNLTSPQGFALAVPSQWTNRLRLTLGPTVTRSMTTEGGVKLLASVSAGYVYQSDPVTMLDAQLFGIPTLAQSAPAGRNGGFVDIGVNASLTKSVTGFVRWRGEARAQARSSQISGGLSVTF